MAKQNYAHDMAKRLREQTLPKMGRHLRMLREALGQSQAQWADTIQISPQLLNKWE